MEKINNALALRQDSNKVLEMTQYWVPPVPDWVPLKKMPNSSLHIACVVEDQLYQGLRFEGEVMLLTPSNWKQVLTYGSPDFLLIESFRTTATGHWHLGQSNASSDQGELLQIIALARKLSIPIVYWITKGHEYHEHYKDFAQHFDYVFCADPKEVELLFRDGVQAELLLPCIQPAMYNPFRLYEHYESFKLNILFDGWADLDRLTDKLNLLHGVKGHGLSIVESRYQMFRNRINILPDYKDCILGCVSKQSRILAMKYAKSYVTSSQTLSTQTTQQWMTIEAAASRLPVVHFGALPDNDLRKQIVLESTKSNEILSEFDRFQENDLYRERCGHLGWRKVYQKHTFAHRMKTICKKIGKEFDWHEFPKASIITPTFRSDLFPNCLKNYEQQTYPNKELILVFNGNYLPLPEELGLKEARDDVKIVNVPEELFAGACLNHGHLYSEGDYCFRVDDDDHYGPNYLFDMILQARCIDADLFGKPPVPICFEADQSMYKRKSFHPLSIVSNSMLSEGKIRLGGNSISGKRELFIKVPYSDYVFGAADSKLLYSLPKRKDNVFVIMDYFNLVAERRSDQSTHTWKQDKDKILNNYTKIGNIDDLMV